MKGMLGASYMRNFGKGMIDRKLYFCSALMYSHRADKQRVDCVDLDPYGTAAPFIDAAVQCVHDGGLCLQICWRGGSGSILMD